MKIDRSRVRKSTSEVPLECQQLIERLQQCSRTELLDELSRIHSWTFGKCELLHWAQVLDVFDRILGTAAERSEDNKWVLKCDTYSPEDFQLLICILRFTSLLIEHSFSRHLYNSMEHLLVLLESNDMSVVLEVLNLLYMFSKRSNFITRLKPDEKECLLSRLQYLAENWGGKENGFGLADCCNLDKEIPASATTLHVEFHREDELKSPKRDIKGEESKGEESKGEESKGEESKGEESKSGESKGGESKGGESKGGESKGGASKAGTSKGGTSKGGTSKGGTSKGGTSKGGTSKGGASKGGESKGGASKGGDSKDGDSKAGDSKGGESKGGDSKDGDSKGGDAKGGESTSSSKVGKPNLYIIHIEHIDKLHKTPAEIMKSLVSLYYVPPEKEMWLFTHVRLATHFADYHNRLKSVQARLQALSVLVYSSAIQDSPSNLLYNGLLEELVEVVELQDPELTDIRCAALRTLTAIIHLDRNTHSSNRRPGSRLNSIIDVTGASQYHGFLPVLVRNCISSLTNQVDFGHSAFKKMKLQDESQYMWIRKLADAGSGEPAKGTAPVGQESVDLTHMDFDVEASAPPPATTIPGDSKFPVSLTTALFSFLYHLASYESGGEALVSCGMMESLLQVINWQGFELDHITFVTRAVRVIDLITNIDMQAFQIHGGLHSFINRLDVEVNFCKKDQLYQIKTNTPEHTFDETAPGPSTTENDEETIASVDLEYVADNVGKTCLPQRAALLKSMLNFLKKAFQDSTFAESIRHLMEGTLPGSLKNIIANAEYYGPSLFLLATDVVTVYVYQEPALLSALQDNGLTDVVLHSLLVKEVPSTREVLGSLPNVFSALCLNARGLESFAKCKPFEKLFNILLSPNYLPAMRRRRSLEPTADTACNLGNAMDELMRHQPSLRQDATLAIINLLEELVYLGTDPKYVCWRPHSKSEVSPSSTSRSTTNTEGSSDEEEEDEDETSTSSQNAQTESQAQVNSERSPIALIDYILNAMKFIDAILSNNSTDDHCREFVEKGGLKPLLKILGLPNLPVDCPVTNPAQAVATVCKSILNLAHEPFLFREGLAQLGAVLESLKPLYGKQEVPGGSKLLLELASASDIESAFSTATSTPLLHSMGAAHGYVIMFVHICRTGQTEIRNLSLQHWGSEDGLKVLKGLADLYTSLVWESTLLLAYCSDDLIPSDCDFTREDIEKLNAFFDRCEGNSTSDTTGTMASAMEALTTNPPPISMEVDCEAGVVINKQDSRNLKYIKPLLGASSRLGRALAELFGLLVKLCVGSPIRQRRGQNMVNATPMPSPYARNVATALNVLLAEGLDCDRLPPCPTAKCRLTFLICSVGFTSPMLFDERRYPYHLMLKKFVSLGGQGIFFKTFRWALNAGNLNADGVIEYSALPEGSLGFLDAWLTLLEKMVNPKAILESPHTISNRPSHSYHFDALKYLIQIHRLAFESVMLLWGKTPLPSYGARMTETLLTILRHIFRGEKIIKEKLKSEENKTTESSSSSSAGPSSGPAIRDTDDNLRQLVDMGFSREHAIEALIHSTTLEQATDYLLSNPPHMSRAGTSMEVESEDDQVLQAIAISLGCTSSPTENKKETPEEQEESFETLINEFTNHALDVCLKLLEAIPETVHKVCELLVTIMKRNGRTYRDNLLDTLITKMIECIESISFCSYNYDANIVSYYSITDSQVARRLTNYIHLYILFFEVPSYFEMKIPCGYAIYRAKLLEPLIEIMCCSIRMMIGLEVSNEPKWLAPSFLLLDAVSKVATCTDRKMKMHMSTNRLWRWYDLVTGKWAHYSNTNNKLINEAYWNGEQSIRVTCGRKRYTVTFANMLQMNDETGNNRPISMTLMSLTHPSSTDIHAPDLVEPIYSTLTDKEEKRCAPVPGLTAFQMREIVRACVRLMQLPIDKDLLQSALQICVRFTRDFEMAKAFVENGGVKCLLKMRHINDFGGFGILATVLIRHALEEPNTLKYAVEKVIRGRTLATIPPPYKDLVYYIRQIGGAVTRAPDVFCEVAGNILRVDISASKGEAPETALPLKVEPLTPRTKAPPLEDNVSIEVVCDLLDALLKPLEDETVNVETEPAKSDSETQVVNVEDETPSTSAAQPSTSTDTTAEDDSGDAKKSLFASKKPMLPKSVILKILADAVVSFGPIAKLITEYKYKASSSDLLLEDMSALAFIFDKILPAADNVSDSDCSTMCRMLIAALASSNHSPEAQITLVSEVKVALTRALYLPESSEKHNQVQHICGIISTMIDNCPLPHANRWTSCSINNIVKLMIRRGVFNDLAKITHYLDLSSPNTSFTANAALKPLESLSRTINQPAPANSQAKTRKSHQSTEETAGAQSGTSTEGTNAQGEEIEDTENTEHDISAVASSLENNAVGTGELDNTLEEMMEILEQRNNDNSQGYNDVASNRNNTMDIDEDGTIGYDHERDATDELMSTDSGESDSNPSDQVDDEGNDDNEADDDNIDDTEENEDNNYDDDDNNDRERRRGSELLEGSSGMFRIATNDRDEDILMIQYDSADNDNPLPRMIRWHENGFAVPILDENNPISDNTIITHPLLMSRSTTDSSQNSVTRNQRANRARRYQYLFSPRNPNPPVILQRLLGPHDPHMANMMSANNLLSGPTEIRESARVVVMDNFGIIPSNEEQIDFVDQSGYLFGPSLAATLSHVPPVLHWWNIESKLLDLESVYDCTTYVCNKLVPNLLKCRNEELRNKKAKEDEENAKKRKQKNEPELHDEYSQETVLFNYDDPNAVPPEQAEQNKEDPDEDIDGVPLVMDIPAEPNSRDDADEDIDGVPLETSDTSNDRSEGNAQGEDIVLSPLQLSFVRGSNENSQSSMSEATQNAAVQTTDAADNMSRHTEDSNSQAESEIRTDSESSSNPFEMTLPAYIRSTRPNIIFARPLSAPPLHSLGDRDQEDNEINETQRSHDLLRFNTPINTANPLRAIFEEAVQQHRESFASDRNPPSEPPEPDQNESSGDGDGSEGSPAAEAGPSNAGDDEIPEGVDPSFLEALPPEMRREVLEQHRILCLQQRIAATAANAATEDPQEPAVSHEVSPEFLAALPPALQEEVLTQQRLEQQRQAAARANPNEPVDAGAFFETLQPSLRTMILSDMEDSQMSALPPNLAAEAQTLRRDWYARNRQMAQERFLQSNLTTIIRHSRGRPPLRPNTFQRSAQWSQWATREFMAAAAANNATPTVAAVKIRGRQLLDHEGLACLLILLFTDDPHLNKLRLHRVIRNLCYHGPTREWIINALLSIIEKIVHIQPDDNLNKPSRKGPRPGPLTSKLLTDAKHLQNGSHWLTIRMEAALGCAANVFIVTKVGGKKLDKTTGSTVISIHPQAAPIVCRNTLDLFTSLAKAFPSCLLPIKCIREDNEKNGFAPVKVKSDTSSDFWDVLLRLDSATKKGKGIQKNNAASTSSDADGVISFEQTVFGKLLNMLASPVVNRNTQLTDNLLKLLSVTTSGMPELVKPHKSGKSKSQSSDLANNPPTHALNLAVNVITYKNCSEEGLEFITNLLLNLANSSLDMSFMILNLLLSGAVEIGNIVENQIQNMLKDLKDLISNTQKRKLEDGNGPSTSKGIIYNRFTNEQVVVTASTKVKTACELQLPSMVPLTSKSSSQVFFLRVLRVIVQIRNSIKQSMKRADTSTYELPALSDQLASLNSLWDTLSSCLLELEHAPDHHAVLVLQPAVEAFFLVHSPQQGPAKGKDKDAKEAEDDESMQDNSEGEQPNDLASTEPSAPEPPQISEPEPQQDLLEGTIAEQDRISEASIKAAVTPEQQLFLGFAEKHRTVLNQILRQSTAHLADGPFAVLVDHTRILDFDIKRRYFRTELERMDHGIRREETAVHVRRSNIFEDSFRELFRRPPEEWKNRFYIVFEDEEGQDAGGLLREWYVIISRDIFNPMYALFTVSPGDRVTYMINSASHYNSNHLCYYKFVGRVIAKAIYDNKLLECYFTRSFYKHILGIPVKYTDMESEDYSFYRGLVYLMENNINNLGLDLTFSTEISEFGVTETRDLIPNGRHITVTEENKMEYVRLVCQMKMTGAIKQQLNSFLEGFYDIIPMRLISIFNEQELELLISGLPNVDIDDLKANTEYHKYQTNSLQIQWFWRALRSFDQADRAKFLQFVTGTSKVPLQGFGALEGMNGVQKFQIHRDDRSTDRLPSAHTCFNQLDLPVYETYDKLRAYLLKAIHECSEGFGFA